MFIKNKTFNCRDRVTEPEIFKARRQLIQSALVLPAVGWAASGNAVTKLYSEIPKGPFSQDLKVTDFEDVSHYTNYYEFSTNKKDAAVLAQKLAVSPWSLTVEGEVDKPGVYDLEELLKQQTLEERIYRFRCVEAWSMVVPWIGFPLGAMLKKFQPTSKAKFVEFTTLYQPDIMIGQRSSILEWPYVEGLRIDEAMHPLTLMATGMYDEKLPKQNGSPLRLVVPWKYGFKSIKAIVKIRFTENMPRTAWNVRAPDEYGFYANVNPQVPHPRWSQASERILGASIFTPRRKTEPFNGYGDHVASLYSSMDLKKFF